MDRYDGVPPYQETIVYVDRVGILLDRYRKDLAAAASAQPAAPSATAVPAATAVAAGG